MTIQKYPEEVREKAIELRRKGMTYREIRERLKEEFKVDVSKETLKRWSHRADLIKFCRPLEERLEMARIVKKLYEEGLGHGRIRKRLVELGYGRVSLSWINYTLRGLHTPDGNLKRIRTSGYAFGYTIGALLSDGHIHKRNNQYICTLTTKDIQFKDKFIDCVKKIGLSTYCYYDKKGKVWTIDTNSKILYNLLKSGKWMELMGYEEIQGFLDGYYDGDGNGLLPSFTSINISMLEYIRKLLKERGIRTSPPILTIKAGTVMRNGVTNYNTYTIYVNPLDYNRFTETVKSCIPRKKYLAELSKKIMKPYLSEIRQREDWWKICRMLQKAVGKCMKSKRKRQTPA